MDLVAELVATVEAPPCLGVAGADVEAVVGESFPRLKSWFLAYDLVALYDLGFPVYVLDDPFAAEELHGAVGLVFDGEEVDEDVRRFWRDVGSAVLVAQVVEADDEAAEFFGRAALHECCCEKRE